MIFDDCKNLNDVVYKVAARAKALADEKTDMLRRSVASDAATTDHAVWKETQGMSRGELIEAILEEEFVEEYPKEIAEEQ